MSTSVLPSHHMIERLLARVLLWLTAHEPRSDDLNPEPQMDLFA